MARVANDSDPDPKSDHRLKVLHFSPSLDQGGLEKLQVEFARHADRDRFDLRFLALGQGGRTVEELRQFTWPVDAMQKPGGLKPLFVLRLARYLWRWKIDVLHSHNGGPLVYGATSARLAKVPVVVHTRHHGRDYVVKHREVRLTTAASRLADRVVCVSEDSLTQGRLDGIEPSRLMTIWNGIDIDRFAYRGPVPTGPAVIVARLQPEKSVDTLVRAVGIVAKEVPDYRLEIAGDGHSMFDLMALVEELGLKENVRFLGNVKDVPGLLARASVLVLPSLTEGISLTLLEAMARGLPAVATKVGGNPEVVVDGETGLLVPVQSPEALASALLRLYRSPDEARRMGIAGRSRVERHFDVKRMVADYEALYLELYRKKRGGQPVGAPTPGNRPADLSQTVEGVEERLVQSYR